MRVNVWLIAALVLLGSIARAADGQFLPPMDRLYENRLEAESAQYISINLYNLPVDARKAADPGQYLITSSDDPAFKDGLRPEKSGSRTRAVRVPLRKDMLVKHTAIFLETSTLR